MKKKYPFDVQFFNLIIYMHSKALVMWELLTCNRTDVDESIKVRPLLVPIGGSPLAGNILSPDTNWTNFDLTAVPQL